MRRPGEDQIIASFNRQHRKTFDRYRHGVRGTHAKSHGILKGEVKIHDNLPEPLRQSLFRAARTYPVVARLASVPGNILADSVTTQRGFALKVIGEELTGEGIASLRVRFRDPRALAEAAFNVRAGLAYLQSKGANVVALTGHSFGGAAASGSSQRAHGRRARHAELRDGPCRPVRPALLGLAPPRDSRPGASGALITARPRDRPGTQATHCYPGVGHVLNEVADEVCREVRGWIITQLNEPAG